MCTQHIRMVSYSESTNQRCQKSKFRLLILKFDLDSSSYLLTHSTHKYLVMEVRVFLLLTFIHLNQEV